VFKIVSAFFHDCDCKRVKWRFLISNVSAGNVCVTCVTGNTLPSSNALSGADQVRERNDYVTLVGCWQGLIKTANKLIQTNRCYGRICQASRCSGRICQASRYSGRICQTSRCSGQICQASRCSGRIRQARRCSDRICQATRCSGRTSTRLAVFRSNLSS
jgi:hypothetical protein